jgi:hypothetical protein
MIEAGKTWALNPTGPSFQEILKRLHDEAISNGELDAKPD